MRTVKAVTPIPRTTLTAAAFEQLISRVVKGNWKPGDRIPPERDLCQQLGIARTSLREALKAMELIGLLDSRVGDGTFVCPRSEFLSRPLLWAFTGSDHSELQDIMEARTIIEENLAGLAAERGSREAIAEIGKAVQMMRDSIARGDSILEADVAFHLAISTAAQNDVLHNAAAQSIAPVDLFQFGFARCIRDRLETSPYRLPGDLAAQAGNGTACHAQAPFRNHGAGQTLHQT
jgi:GntR family transcriptional repressor for pyruvate dehydrogenase complex